MEPGPGDVEVDPSAAELLDAFKSTYERIGHVAGRAKDAATYAFALAELLVGRGLIGMDELETVRRRVDDRMAGDARERSLMINVLEDATDKYKAATTVEDIDCDERIPLCQGACCRLRFALSEQDVEERIVQWSPAEPYMNRQGPDGWCVHSSGTDRHCTVYAARPLVCRSYDCRRDTRIWQDFEARVVNPDLAALLEKIAEAGVPVAAPRARQAD